MKKVLLTLASVGALALTIPVALMAQGMAKMEMPKGKTVTITGTVVDVSCKFGQGLHGEQHRMCAQICSDRGLPLAVLGDDGKLYIPASDKMPGDAQNSRLKDFAEHRVTIVGKAFHAGGAEAIQITTVTPAA